MALLKIRKFPDDTLKEPAAPVKNINGNVEGLIDSMVQTMYAAPGVGLAAPQVGESKRIIVLDTDHENPGKHLLKLINPKVVEAEGKIIWEEGCLSVIDYTADVERAAHVLVRAWTPDEKEIEIEADELLAVALQHEIDHLDGKLFIDRISPNQARTVQAQTEKANQGGQGRQRSAPPRCGSKIADPLKIVFMGTPALAAHILERLMTASGAIFRVVGVVTRPDKPRGRGLGMEPSEVGAVAATHNIPALKPLKIRTPEFLNELKAFDPDLLVVAAYGRILPNSILAVPKIAPINVHASLLPRHRGAAPIEGAILAGDAETGVTIMRIVERMDAGPMYFQRKTSDRTGRHAGDAEGKTRGAWRIRDSRGDRSRLARRTH